MSYDANQEPEAASLSQRSFDVATGPLGMTTDVTIVDNGGQYWSQMPIE